MIEMPVENEVSVEETAGDSAPPGVQRAGRSSALAGCCSPSASRRTKPGGDGVNDSAPSSGASLGPERGASDPAGAASNSAAAGTKAQERRGTEGGQRAGQLLKPKNGLQQQQQQQQHYNQAQKPNKRRNSVNIGFKHPGCKRRRRANSESDPVLPTNFLLGGNIFDPLNLNSLLDEEVNRALNAETPKSSPLPRKNREEPVEILIPKDITDPLNLKCGGDVLVSPVKGGGRKRHRHRHHGGGGGGGGGGAGGAGGPPQTQTQTQTQPSGNAALEKPAETAGHKPRQTPPVAVAADEGSAVASLNHPLHHHLPPPPPPASSSSVSDSFLCPPPAAPPPSSVLSATSVLPSSSSSPSARPVQHGGPGTAGTTKPALLLSPPPPPPSRRASAGSAPAAAGSLSPPSSGVPEPYELNTSINCRDEVVQPLLPAARTAAASSSTSSSSAAASNDNNSSSLPSNSHPSSSSSRQRKRRRVSSSKSETVGGGAGEREKNLAQELEKGKAGGGGGGGGGIGKKQLPNNNKQGPKHKQRKFQYGNYNKYYGYRNPGWSEDPRAGVLKPEWFRGKAVLDLGCNAGHLTLAIARDCGPARIVGVDIDGGLIHCARQNIRHYLSERAGGGPPGRRFPDSLAVCHGPIAAPPVCGELPGAAVEFPDNVSFLQCNYVLQQDALLLTQKPEYDVILCLSVSKWVHLNWGDEGLKRLFKRVYRHLQPGGVFILEPQPWTSYGKRKKLTETICSNYYNIRLKPDQFSSYLVSPEVGFSSYELLGTPHSAHKGFQRPIYLYRKGLPSVEK